MSKIRAQSKRKEIDIKYLLDFLLIRFCHESEALHLR